MNSTEKTNAFQQAREEAGRIAVITEVTLPKPSNSDRLAEVEHALGVAVKMLNEHHRILAELLPTVNKLMEAQITGTQDAALGDGQAGPAVHTPGQKNP